MHTLLFQLPAHAVLLLLRTLLPKLGDLEKENLFLRYQLLLLKKQVGRAKVNPAERTVLTTLARSVGAWKSACFIVKPETLLSWHKRIAVRLKWNGKTCGRHPIDRDLRRLVIRMKVENRLWGPKRIHGELLKLGFTVSESSIRNILRWADLRRGPSSSGETWREFIDRHKDVWAMDFFTVHSATLKRFYVFVLMDIHTRELLCARVTSKPTAEWVSNVLKGTLLAREAPSAIIMDRDPAFGAHTVGALLRSSGIRALRCLRKSPLANARVERLNGTFQRECTDHFLFLTEGQLQRAVSEYGKYYNEARCHQALEQRPPLAGPPPKTSWKPDPDGIQSRPYLGGLHNEYFQAA